MREMMPKRHTRFVWMIMLVMLLVTACFRQASEPFESSDAPLTPTSPADASENSGDDVTPTINIPVITSTPITFSDEPTATVTLSEATEVPLDAGTATAEPTLIVPGLPSGPVETNTPSPTDTPDALQPTLVPLATPVDPFAEAANDCIYIVVGGDTVFRIALNNNTTVDEIQAANPNLNPNLIDVGDEIILPNCEPATAPDPVPQGAGIDPPPTNAVGPVAPAGPQPTAQPIIHVVATGETLGRIAAQYGVTVLQIVQANNLTDPNRLSIGQELVIPPLDE